MAAFTKREIAFAATKYVYRDTDHLDIRHGEDGRLTPETYEDMHNTVVDRMDMILPLVKFMSMDKESLEKLEPEMSDSDKITIRICKMLAREMGSLPPAKVVGKPVDDDLAVFLLESRFKKACDSGEKLTDDLMNEIRIDVHNKMYSLLNVIVPEC